MLPKFVGNLSSKLSLTQHIKLGGWMPINSEVERNLEKKKKYSSVLYFSN